MVAAGAGQRFERQHLGGARRADFLPTHPSGTCHGAGRGSRRAARACGGRRGRAGAATAGAAAAAPSSVPRDAPSPRPACSAGSFPSSPQPNAHLLLRELLPEKRQQLGDLGRGRVARDVVDAQPAGRGGAAAPRRRARQAPLRSLHLGLEALQVGCGRAARVSERAGGLDDARLLAGARAEGGWGGWRRGEARGRTFGARWSQLAERRPPAFASRVAEAAGARPAPRSGKWTKAGPEERVQAPAAHLPGPLRRPRGCHRGGRTPPARARAPRRRRAARAGQRGPPGRPGTPAGARVRP
jgi:hypothetical protein